MTGFGQPSEVIRVPLDWRLEPERAALLVRRDPRPFALIGAWAGGGAVIGSDPIRVATPVDDPFALLDDQPEVTAGEGAVAGGWFGYLGYQLGRLIEPIGASPPVSAGMPRSRSRSTTTCCASTLWASGGSRRCGPTSGRRRCGVGCASSTTAPLAAEPEPFTTMPWRPTPTAEGHELAVPAARERIHAGDLFQANICVRLESRIAGDPLDLFARAPPRSAPTARHMSRGRGAPSRASRPSCSSSAVGAGSAARPIKGTRGLDARDELRVVGQGPRRERDDRRPRPQRPRPRLRARPIESRRSRVLGSTRACGTSSLRSRGRSATASATATGAGSVPPGPSPARRKSRR